ncbi:hypothetical protein FAVG1_00318 [Fusarium avenaceum]|nr:hypothetical protein FAVG1_00318 [Fusarium avenaceum]
MENQPDNRIVNLATLDMFLEHVPDPHARRHIRDQVFFAIEKVEKKEEEVTRLKAEAEAFCAQVQEQKGELEAKQKALSDEQARLNAIAEKACTLPERVDGLARQVNQVSTSFTKDSKTLVDKLDAVQNSSEKSRQAIKGDITGLSDKVNAGRKSAQDLSAKSVKTIKDDIAERITELRDTSLTREKGIKDEITRLIDLAVSAIEQKQKTAMGPVTKSLGDAAAGQQKMTTDIGYIVKDVATLVVDQQVMFETLTGEGTTSGSWATTAQVEAIEKSLGSLPSKADLSKALDEANKSAGLLEKYHEVTQERDESRVEVQSLKAEMNNLKERAAIEVRAASDREALTNDKLELERQRVQRRDNTIQDLQNTHAATYQQLEQAQGGLEDYADLQQQLQDAQGRLEAAETAAQELEQTREQLRRSEEAEGRYSREITRQRGSIDQEKKLNAERSKQIKEISDHLATSREQAEQARVKAEETAAELRMRFEQQGALHQELKDAWANERAALQEKVSDRDMLLHNQGQDLVSLRSRVAETESLQKNLDDARTQVERLDDLLNEASHKAETCGQELAVARSQEQELKRALATSNSELEDAKRLANGLEQSLRDAQSDFEGRLKDANRKAETYSQQLSEARIGKQDLTRALASSNSELEDTRRQVIGLEQRLIDAQSRISTFEDQTSMPQGILSGLADMYVKLAREFQDIPTAPGNIYSFDMTEVAVEIAPLLAQYEAKDNLLAFLNAQTPDWHCLQQVVDGDRLSVVQDQCGQHRGSCVLVRVITLGTAVLEFKIVSN